MSSSYLSIEDSATLSPFGDDEVTPSPNEVAAMLSPPDGEDPPDGADGGPPAAAGAVEVPAEAVAVRPSGLARPGRAGFPSTLVAAGGGPVRTGETLLFCHPLVAAPAVVRRGGEVQVGGWLPDHVRLGALERRLGEGVVEEVVARLAAQVVDDAAAGNPKKRRDRTMSLPLTARMALAAALTPEAGRREALARLVGLLPTLSWRRPWRVPSSTVCTDWLRRLGDRAAEELFRRAAGPLVPGADWCGRRLAAADGFCARLPATEANRAAFGVAGTAGDDGAFPLLRAVIATARAGRAVLGAALGTSHDGEQTLLRRLLEDQPEIFGPDWVYLVDRNFPGHDLIVEVRTAGADLIMRMKAGVTLTRVRWLPDGSYLAYLTAPDGNSALMLRVVEYTPVLPGRETAELVCLATTLLDHELYPAGAIRDAYPQRWVASETTIGENKSTITGAGPSVGPMLRSGEPVLVRQEFWFWLCAAQLVRGVAAEAAATGGVHTDRVSFTAVRHEATRSLAQTRASATSSPAALAALAAATTLTALTSLITTGRDRHSPRERKYLPRFPRRSRTKPTTRGPATIICHHPGADPAAPQTPGTS
jgi:hypothetical protein